MTTDRPQLGDDIFPGPVAPIPESVEPYVVPDDEENFVRYCEHIDRGYRSHSERNRDIAWQRVYPRLLEIARRYYEIYMHLKPTNEHWRYGPILNRIGGMIPRDAITGSTEHAGSGAGGHHFPEPAAQEDDTV